MDNVALSANTPGSVATGAIAYTSPEVTALDDLVFEVDSLTSSDAAGLGLLAMLRRKRRRA